MIEFTQFLRPHGERKTVTIERGTEVEGKAKALKAAGYSFEAEVLPDGLVHFEIVSANGEVILASELVPNGPEVPPAVDRLVREAHEVYNGG